MGDVPGTWLGGGRDSLQRSLRQDRVTYRSQEMWLESVGPITAYLENASDGTLTLPEVIPIYATDLTAVDRDASEHHSSMRRQA